MKSRSFSACAALLALLLACGGPETIDGPGTSGGPEPVAGRLTILGSGVVTERYTAEVWAHGNFAYTGTGSKDGVPGNAVKIWNISGAQPTLVDSVIIADAGQVSDIQVTDDGALLVVSTEPAPGAIYIYSLSNPGKPALVSRFNSPSTNPGVHTAEVQRVGGVLYAFLSTDRSQTDPSRLVIVDLRTPAKPMEIFSEPMGNPFVHDVFVRDGILFVMAWNAGVEIYDIGGGGRGGSPSSPVLISRAATVGGKVHNAWWYHDPSGAKRYLFVGEEGPRTTDVLSQGDIHVMDVSDMSNPREVAFYSVPSAGTHNFSVDESRGILYAAYYNGGVRAIDIRGDLGGCASAQKSADGRCDLVKMGREVAVGLSDAGKSVFVWGVRFLARKVYVSDLLNGLWVLGEAP